MEARASGRLVAAGVVCLLGCGGLESARPGLRLAGGMLVASAMGCAAMLLRAGGKARRAGAARSRLLEIAIANVSAGVCEIDAGGRITFTNPEFDRIAGRPGGDAAGLRLAELVEPRDRDLLGDSGEAGVSREGLDRELRIVRPDGSVRTVAARRAPVPDTTGEEHAPVTIWSFVDTTDSVESRRRSVRLRQLIDTTPDLVMFTDLSGRLLDVNEVARNYFALAPDEPLDRHSFLDLLDEVQRETYRDEAIPAVLGQGVWEGDFELRIAAGLGIPVSVLVVAHRAQGNEEPILSVVARDISRLKAAEEALERQATHDSLTGLPNRRLFFDRLRGALARLRRRRSILALLFLDLDGFKKVNDVMGHDAGDALLVEIATRLTRSVRATDTVGRLGGDEFVVILEDVREQDDCGSVARKLIDAIEQPVGLAEGEARVSTSVGIATTRDFAADTEEMLRDADAAMYRAKKRGRARFVYAHDVRAGEEHEIPAATSPATGALASGSD